MVSDFSFLELIEKDGRSSFLQNVSQFLPDTRHITDASNPSARQT